MPDRILLLEDEPFIALDLEGVLEEHGYDDVVAIVNPHLPDGLCSAVVRHLARGQVPFVVYSGEPGSLIDEEPAFENGEHLSKPAMPDDVIAAVRRALAAV